MSASESVGAAACLVLLGMQDAHAQFDSIRGAVFGSDEVAVPEVPIRARALDAAAQTKTFSGPDGCYRIDALPTH